MTRPHIIDNPEPPLDAAIVGAGPAGSWAAYRLARAGARVALFDASHPREKPCGGGVTGRALAIVAGAAATSTLPNVRVEAARFEHDGSPDAVVALAHGSSASGGDLLVFSRSAFDGALLQAAVRAGARLRRRRVVDVCARADGVELRTADGGRARARLVLAADGAASLVRRRVADPLDRSQISIATGYLAHGLSSREIVVRFTARPAGYYWSFPRPNHLAIGVCAQADRAQVGSLRRGVEAWIASRPIRPPARLERYSWPIPSLDAAALERERPAGPRWMLLGDAAGLVDPITREGIHFALRSADLASQAILAEREPCASYADALRSTVYPELRRAARLKRSFFAPRFLRLLHGALRTSAGVRAVMADLIAGRQAYHGLERRLLGTLELGLAWRLLMRRG